MAKLHELLAVETSLRSQAEACRRDLMNTFEKKKTHFSEAVQTFQSNQEGVVPVTESRLGLQTTMYKEFAWITEKLAKAFDVAYQIDEANTEARENVVLANGDVLLTQVPATSLLQLEKRLKELQEFAAAIPTLDPAKGFEIDKSRGIDIYKARDVVKARTQKVKEWITVAAATDKHPAQVVENVKDVEIGTIQLQEWSSLISTAEKGDILDRIEELIRAVKGARSRANEIPVDVASKKIGARLLAYVFQGK